MIIEQVIIVVKRFNYNYKQDTQLKKGNKSINHRITLP